MDGLGEYAREGQGTFGPVMDRVAVESPESARDAIGNLEWADREMCVVLVLNTKHHVLGRDVVSVGSVDHTFMAPREIFRDVLSYPSAASIVMAHNHPSGDSEPSSDDRGVTRRIKSAGELLGVEVLDHLVIGDEGRWVSMARRGEM